VLQLLAKRFEVEGYRLEIGASVGIAMAPRDAGTADGLLRCADVAMYSAKRSRTGYAVYSSSQDPYTAERLTLLSELSGAFRRGEMVLHYQPRVSLAQKRLRGFEALVRWNHPRLGRLPPAQFIPLAELSDVIRPLTLWILEQGLRQQREWADAGHPTRLAINFSARHLLDDDCPDQIAALLAREGIAAESLELEITESALIADPEHATATLERIRALGVQIAVDDYGTGYSSLSHLRRLPLHALKIDVSFVRNMLRNAQDRVIVESTVGLAHNLGLNVVAEGIEDEGTLAALRAMGCDEGQGFYIGAPMDAEEAARWMRASPLALH
jgi:EAL domain-containing protein (putative c-di-GMP-specific phosphodiesterase class I)